MYMVPGVLRDAHGGLMRPWPALLQCMGRRTRARGARPREPHDCLLYSPVPVYSERSASITRSKQYKWNEYRGRRTLLSHVVRAGQGAIFSAQAIMQ